jgi:diguanylate cyclase (GGDEF)-like protein
MSSGALDSDAAFVEAVLAVQTLVSHRAPPTRIYQAVVDGALRMLHGDGGSLRFVDRHDPTWMVAVAWHGAAGLGERWRHRAPTTEGVSGRVISTGKLVTLDDQRAGQTGSQLAPADTRAIVGVPLHEHGLVIGSLVVSSSIEGRHWTEHDCDLLLAYSEKVGVAVTVARAHEAMRQALTDPLTGLGNRALLLDRLEHELVRADRGGQPVTMLFMDLDRFKLVNDSLGHLVGDRLLKAVAERLVHCVRDADTCARLGGDEFAVLLAGGGDPVAVAERIIDALQRRFQIGEHDVSISVSVGIASGREQAETLLRNADVAMYQAKRAGAGRYTHFEPGMHATLVSRLELVTDLRRATERGQFEMHYQPMFDLRSGKIAALEGLVRWRHPTRGLVEPVEFIPVAEETEMILDIGRWVLEHGCSQLAAWRRETPLALSLNVSTRELQQPGYAATVQDAIGGAFPPSALILEITERVPLEDAPGVLATLHALKELGVRVALDDFGTGYSTLLNLTRLPVDLLKIAKPFLDAVDRDVRNPAGLLAGIIGLGQHLGVMTVAEGIERPEQRDVLIQSGCDFGQGYLLGRPLDAGAAAQLISAERPRSLSDATRR